MAAADLTGRRFGSLVALEREGATRWGTPLWRCRCDCGTEKLVASHNLLGGSTKSCGCRQGEHRPFVKHGAARRKSITAEYRIWQHVRSRCNDSGSDSWKWYGGRGISVCTRWDSFEAFLADMGPRPSPLHSIDRKDNDGNYEPGNCRWTTSGVQLANQRKRGISRAAAADLRSMVAAGATVKKAAQKYGLPYSTAYWIARGVSKAPRKEE